MNASGAENYDSWSISQGGTRLDGSLSQKDTVTFDGQGYSGRVRDVRPDFHTHFGRSRASGFSWRSEGRARPGALEAYV